MKTYTRRTATTGKRCTHCNLKINVNDVYYQGKIQNRSTVKLWPVCVHCYTQVLRLPLNKTVMRKLTGW